MRPPLRSTPFDATLEHWTRRLFVVCLLGMAALFIYTYVEARCNCRDWCRQQGGWMQAFDFEMDSRFHSVPDRCWCQLNDEIKEFAL